MHENEITHIIIKYGIEIHKALGPGLLESVYEKFLYDELIENNLKVERQKKLPIKYKNREINMYFRTDLIVENKVIIEIKSVENLLPLHFKQLLTYLKLSDLRLGLLINFNVNILKDGIHRVVNNFY